MGVEGGRQMKRDESLQFEMEVALYNQTIERMEEVLEDYHLRISEANLTLNSLEQDQSSLASKEGGTGPGVVETVTRTHINLWPALAVSVAANLAMGGILVTSGTLELPQGLGETEMEYDYNQGVEMEVGAPLDPLMKLEEIRREREKVVGTKSDFMRRRGPDFRSGR